MINPFKLLYRSGRQAIVSDAWDETVTPDKITELVSEQVTKAIAESNLPLDKAVAIAEYAGKATDIVGDIFRAMEDRTVTIEEARAILAKVFAVFGMNLTDTLSAVKSKVIERIP